MDLRQLRYVLSVYRHRMAARAAAEFGVAQSTITMSLRRLEDEIGAPLFERRAGGVRPNDTLRRLRRLCEPLLYDLESACRYVSARLKERPFRILFVGIEQPSGSQLDLLLTGMLAQWRARHPEVFLRYSSAPGDSTDDAGSPRIELAWSAPGRKEADFVLWNVEWSLVACGAARRLPDKVKLQQLQGMRIALAAGLGELGATAKRTANDAGLSVAADIDADMADAEYLDRRGISLLIPSILIHPGLVRHPCRAIRLQMPGRAGALHMKLPSSGAAREIGKKIADTLGKRLKRPNGWGTPAKRSTSDIDMRQLIYFTYLYEEQSVVRAAARANIVQPALSMQLRKLERALRVKLFQRNPRGLEPLTTADQLYALCHSAILALETAPRQLRTGQAPDAESLRVGLLPALDEESVLAKAVGATIETWREHYPQHQIRVSEAYSEVLRRWTQEKAIDLAIVLGPPPSERQLEFEALIRDPLAVITNREADLLPEGPVDLRKVAKLPLVLPSPHHGIRRLIEARFKGEGIAIEPKLEFDSMAVAISLVRSGKWATILPVSAVLHGVTHGFLSVHPVSNKPPLMRELWAVRHSDTKMTEPTRGFIKLFKANFNRLLATQHETKPELQLQTER